MDGIDAAWGIYAVFMLISLIISYKFASYMIRKTGLFFSYSFIATMMNLMLFIVAVVGWFLFAWEKNEFLFFGGLYIGVIAILVSELILVIALLIRRKSILKDYNDSIDDTI